MYFFDTSMVAGQGGQWGEREHFDVKVDEPFQDILESMKISTISYHYLL